MSGCTWLTRLVTSTLPANSPGPTARLSASTSSTMQVSSAKQIASLPGSLTPHSPSLEPNVLVICTPNASSIERRIGVDSGSLVALTASGAMDNRPDRHRVGETHEHGGVADDEQRLHVVESADDLLERQCCRNR